VEQPQQQQQQISTIEIDGRISALVAQRNAAMDQIAVIAGQLASRDARIKELEAAAAPAAPAIAPAPDTQPTE